VGQASFKGLPGHTAQLAMLSFRGKNFVLKGAQLRLLVDEVPTPTKMR
jgi:hypothetical protein